MFNLSMSLVKGLGVGWQETYVSSKILWYVFLAIKVL